MVVSGVSSTDCCATLLPCADALCAELSVYLLPLSFCLILTESNRDCVPQGQQGVAVVL